MKGLQFQETVYPFENNAPSPQKWALCGTFLLLIAVLLRSWPTLSQQAFFVEDSLIFSMYYGNFRPLGSIAGHHLAQPYIILLTKAFGWLYAYTDVRLHALLYQWTGFIFGMVAAVILFYSGLIRSRTILLLGPLLMGLTAMNHIYYYNTLIYIMYSGLAILLALLFFPLPKRAITKVLLMVIVVILPWSGPYSVVAVPTTLVLILLYPEKSFKTFLFLAVLVSTILYFLTVAGDTAMLKHLKKWGVIIRYFEVLLEHVVFLGQFRYKHISNWQWIPVLLVISLCFYLLRHDPDYIKNSLIFFGIIMASLALFFLSSKLQFYQFTNPCHRFLSLYFWCFFLLYTIDGLFIRYGCNQVISIVFAAMLSTIIIHDNIRHPRKHTVEPIPETRDFLNNVYRLEQLRLEADNQQVILRLDNYQSPFFVPQAVVGSRADDARRLNNVDLPADYRNSFVADEK